MVRLVNVHEAKTTLSRLLEAVERGEQVELPPALWIQSRPDFMHDYRDPDSPIDANEPERFAHNYRAAGGSINISDISQDARDAESTHELVARFLLDQAG